MVFFDTNILLYRIDYRSPLKQQVAERLLALHYEAGDVAMSTQVLQEFYSIAAGKLRVAPHLAAELVKGFACGLVIQVTPAVIFAAMTRHAEGGFSFWDALIVEAALTAGARVLYSEDMQHGRVIDGRLTLCNPFLTA